MTTIEEYTKALPTNVFTITITNAIGRLDHIEATECECGALVKLTRYSHHLHAAHGLPMIYIAGLIERLNRVLSGDSLMRMVRDPMDDDYLQTIGAVMVEQIEEFNQFLRERGYNV